ncbi:MAG TPA: M20/M25/M40 family metallo-hydrolase [Ktedonobacteraceae bacterium]|nr:M20/M25/M40 family metallo-hydrolase [Ktedonobacteraceae bacterium]
MSETVELLRQLVAIDSINPDLVPGGAGEGNIARFVAQWFERTGLEVILDEAAPGRPNVIGIARGTGRGRSLLLNAHMDTVGVKGMQRPHDPYIENNRLYGRGSYDMKGGLAAIMIAGAAAKQRGLRGDVIVTAVIDEEYASLGTSSIVKQWRADAAIVTEPTDLEICTAHKGYAWFTIETTGVAAHGSRSDIGVDAIVKMGKVLQGVEELDRALHSANPHPLLGTGSIHASLIEGGQEISSYPAHCSLSVERRTIPGEILSQVEAELPAICSRIAASDPTFWATTRIGFARETFEVSLHEPIAQTVIQQAQKLLGRDIDEVGGTGWMDSALLAAAGIPTVIFGPGGEGAHAVVEWSDIAQVEQCAEILSMVADKFCQ